MNNPLVLSITLAAISLAAWSVFVGFQLAKQKYKPKRNALGRFAK